MSIGIGDDAISSGVAAAVAVDHFSSHCAQALLDQLQTITISTGHGCEAALIAQPSRCVPGFLFPFAVLEAKAYATGGQVFEAQNQAAVAGAVALRIQLSLNGLVQRTSAGAAVPPALFFSITTQGPYLELWAHYTLVEHGVRAVPPAAAGDLQRHAAEERRGLCRRAGPGAAMGRGRLLRVGGAASGRRGARGCGLAPSGLASIVTRQIYLMYVVISEPAA